LNQTHNLLANYLMGPAELAEFCAGADIYTDDLPQLDYETQSADLDSADETPLIDAIERNVSSISDVATSDLEQTRGVRELNLADMRAQVLVRRVESLREISGYAQIASLLNSALRLNPQNANANRLMGDALLYQGMAGNALEHFDAALALLPEDGRARYGRAVSLHRLGRIDEAIPEYRAAIALRPHDPEYHNNLGAALGQSGRFEEAIQAFETALRLNPNSPDARNNLRRTLEIMDRQR
jgi:Flp pilus assembly protein TadD